MDSPSVLQTTSANKKNHFMHTDGARRGAKSEALDSSFTLGILGPPATAVYERRGQFARVSLLEQAE